MENEYGQVISGQYSEYASGSGETDEEVTNIKSIIVTVNVKSTDRMKEVNKYLRLHQPEEFTSKIS